MATFAENLLDWYDKNQRSLPWRATQGQRADPYHVWLSEIMLQQTTVATVKAYFEKFLRLWPTVNDLAAAPRDDILKEWAGLGYYARARNLHKCAQLVVSNYGGQFPENETDLKTLPGIGDYTAAAIAAIAFGEPAAVVDGNIERIITRQHRISVPLPASKKIIKQEVAAITPQNRPGDFAQAMMDLGASHCSPKKPSCFLCPVPASCAARAEGDMETYPIKAPKKAKPTRRAVSFWLEHDGHILLERRPDKGLLGGMPGFFSTPWVERDTVPEEAEYLQHAPADCTWVGLPNLAKHTFTHFHLQTQLVRAIAPSKLNIENGFWQKIPNLADVGLPTVFNKIGALAD